MSFGADPVAAVLDVLRQVDEACSVADIKKALEHAGASRPEVDAGWPSVQKRLRHHPYVLIDDSRSALTYRFRHNQPASPAEALERLLAGGLPADVRAAFVGLVRDALRRSALDPEEAGRRRQAKVDGLRAL